ncbi:MULTISPECIES: hypothetical protein [Microvirga]|uniref:hypothetical protein n=1 Tax=Microvirga TaxID=186650 RepID=UPI001CFF652E|nr:hypothetical protein [Microvirga lenta]MCB5176406.1 hypothetical protein [Microvirga lenta]
MFRVLAATAALGGLLAGCDLPRDPEETLEMVRGKELRVGVLQSDRNAEQDRAVVEILAENLQSQPVYTEGDAHRLFEELDRGHIHLIIGGVPKSTPFKKAGFSKAVGPLYGSAEEEKRVLAVRAGENAFLLRVNRAIEAAKAAGASS